VGRGWCIKSVAPESPKPSNGIPAALKKLIKFVSVRASKIASQSALAKAAGGGSGGLRAIQPSGPAAAGAAPSAAPLTGDSPAEEYPSAAPPPPAVTTEKQKELNRQLAEVKLDITEEEEW
jgi:NAD(P)H-dependent FMN reductase